jgi:hypothetical protein
MKKISLLTAVVGTLVWGLAHFQYHGASAAEMQGDAPVIVDSYALDVIRPGATWRVYLQAKDNDGDMKDIVAILNQSGFPPSTDITQIKAKDSKELAGYLYFKTPQDNNLILSYRFSLEVFIRDALGNKSEKIEFPLRFDMVRPASVPEQWAKGANRRLGAIMIDIQGVQPRGQGMGL